MTAAGAQPQSPASLRDQLISKVVATNPGYTANLPGSMVEDISSTDVAAVAMCDSAYIESVNNITPYGANEYVLSQQGQMFGINQGVGFNTSVNVIFSGSPGYVIGKGFVVSDGTYQYIVQDTTVIASGGQSSSTFCLASQSGSWAVPSGTVTQIVTSVPATVTLTVTNPSAGIPATDTQTAESYRAQVLQAFPAVAQGMPAALRTALQKVAGVQSRLVSVRQKTNQWEVICGGGDPYEVANAIYTSLFDVSNLVGSTINVTGITKANPGVVTTDLNHGYTNGQVAQINGIVGMTALNGVNVTVTVITPNSFSIGVNTSGYATYVSGGVVTPNFRNVTVSINDFPDTYVIPFVIPPSQAVGITVTWNTTSTNFVSNAAVSQLAQPELISYVNSLVVGQPLNLLEMQQTFQNAIASILPSQLLTSLSFAITVNGISVSPAMGSSIIPGDPESYFLTSSANVAIVQG
jgi:hypothetical protein